MDKGKYYITTAIAYTSRIPHIGNTYEAVLADAIARYRRLEGYDVYFLTGTDEHGQKIQDQAEKAGKTPQAHVDEIAGEIRKIWDFMNVSYDQFIRTTDPKHEKIVQKIFKKLYEQGDIYKGHYEGYYCKPCESFFTATQVVDGKCPDCGAPVETAREEAYFFKMSKYADRLMQHIESHPEFIQPESRKNEMINNFIKPGLQDLCVSRTSFSWGVPVDFDPGHVVYVWIDALSNYITALGYDPDGSSDLFNKYWPANVHLIGKDILRFHTIYWPIMLMALGVELPKQVFGHPWLLMGEDKMSKSKGNVVYASELVDLFGVDATRYYMLHEMPFASDGNFTWELIIQRINSDLANILGNLVNRTVAMINKYFDGVIPAPVEIGDAFDADLKAVAVSTAARTAKCMETLHVADALDEIWATLRRSNKYIDETMPWALAKSEETRERLGTVMYNLVESIRIAAVHLSAFLPETAQKIFSQLNISETNYESTLTFGATKPGVKVGEASPLFARIDEKAKLADIEAMITAKQAAAAAEAAKDEEPEGVALISIDDFAKVDLRVAKVTACEPIPKAKKLLKLQLDVGGKPRQVVSGIAQWYKPEDLIGRSVVIVANLTPVKLRGELSEGMILAADHDENDVRVIFVDDINSGASIH